MVALLKEVARECVKTDMGAFTSLTTLFGCGFFGLACLVPHAAPHVAVHIVATSSPDVTVTSTVDGKTHMDVIKAPYGVQTNVVTHADRSRTVTEATTTPLTATDVAHMHAQAQVMQQRMDRIMADEERLFQELQTER